MTIEFVYTAVAESGSGIYHRSRFLGTAFSEEELLALMEQNTRGPTPGERFDIARRKIGAKKTEHCSAWRVHGLKRDLETAVWR